MSTAKGCNQKKGSFAGMYLCIEYWANCSALIASADWKAQSVLALYLLPILSQTQNRQRALAAIVEQVESWELLRKKWKTGGAWKFNPGLESIIIFPIPHWASAPAKYCGEKKSARFQLSKDRTVAAVLADLLFSPAARIAHNHRKNSRR
jgi:hypothetical protein